MASNDSLLEVRLRLQGARQFITEAVGAAKSVSTFGVASEEAAAKSRLASIEARALQQTMYSLRRYAFYGTTAVLAFGAASLKLGLSFDEAKTSGTTAFTAILGGAGAANREMSALVGLTHQTGIQLETLTGAATTMQSFGFSIRDVNKDLLALGNFAQRAGLGSSGLGSLVQVFDRVRQAGRLTSLDIRTLTGLHVPALSILTRQLHLTALQAAQLRSGKLIIPSQFALPALATGIGQRAGQLGTGIGQQVGIARSYLSSILGGGEQGIFSFATRGLEQINKAFAARTRGGSFLQTIDPSGNLLLGWHLLGAAISGVISPVYGFIRGVSWLLAHIPGLGSVLGFAARQTWLVHGALFALSTLYLVTRTRMLAFWAAEKLITVGQTLYLGALYALDVAMALFAGDTAAAAAAMTGLDIAFYANPIGLIVLGVIALGVAMYELVSHAGAVGHAFVVAFDAVKGAVKSALNFIIGGWDWLADKLTIPGVSVFGHHLGGQSLLPHIPKLDQGGFVSQTGLAVVHRGETYSGVGPNGAALQRKTLDEPLHINLAIYMDSEKFATALVKLQGARDIFASAVFQAQDATAGRA